MHKVFPLFSAVCPYRFQYHRNELLGADFQPRNMLGNAKSVLPVAIIPSIASAETFLKISTKNSSPSHRMGVCALSRLNSIATAGDSCSLQICRSQPVGAHHSESFAAHALALHTLLPPGKRFSAPDGSDDWCKRRRTMEARFA